MSHATTLNCGKRVNRIQKGSDAVQSCTHKTKQNKNKKEGQFLQNLNASEIGCDLQDFET